MLDTLPLRDSIYLFALLFGASLGCFIRSILKKRVLGMLLSPALLLLFFAFLIVPLSRCSVSLCLDFLPFIITLFLLFLLVFLLPPQVFMSALVLSVFLCGASITMIGPLSAGASLAFARFEIGPQGLLYLRTEYGLGSELNVVPEGELSLKVDMLSIHYTVPFIGGSYIVRQVSVGNDVSWSELFPFAIGSPAILRKLPMLPLVEVQEREVPLDTQQLRRGLSYAIALDEDTARLEAVF
jgi:hypothetical protein